MQIYNPNNELILDIDVSDSSFATDAIMNEDTLSLEFEMTDYLEVPVDSYCTFRNKVYYLLKDSDFTKNGERNYAYKLVMHTDASKSKDVKYGFATVTRNAGQLPKFDYAKKIEFNLTGKPIDFAQLWVDNMNIANGEDAWTVGECIDAPMQTLDFNDQWCFDVLGQLSEAFETEWEIENKTLHIRMVEKMKDSAFPLSYGLGNGLLKGLSRVNYNNGKMINRLIMKGSDRNIVFASYGDTNLHMKKNATIKYDGNYFSDEPEFVDSPNAIEYVTDANGSYVERSDRTGRVKEDSLDLTTIYPMHEGTITSVDPDNDLIFYDVNNTINYYDLLIPGNTMQLIPQSGDLIGKEFDVNYNHANKRFTLKRIEGNNDVTYPSGNLIPRVGDKYAVFKIELPQEYIDEAELAALKKCVKYLYENEVPQYTYTGQLDPIYAEEHWLEIGGYLNCGYFVRFSDDKFLPDGRDIRITQVDYYVNDEMHPKITLSNKVTGKSFTNKQNKIDNQEQTIDRSKDDAIQYAKRRYRDTQETMEMLQESLLNFSEGINPITVQTMQLIAGSPTLQFRFVNSKTDPISPVMYNIIYDPVTKKLHCPSGILQHMTLGIDNITSSRGSDEYFFWDIAEYLSPILDDPNKRYYLYAKCENTGNKTDGTGIFLLSETAIDMEAETGYYYFLVGLLNSEYEDDRSFATMYGYTEVLPGRITTDKIVSSDGNNFLDFINNAFRVGDNNRYLAWNVINGLLEIMNATLEMRNSGNEIVARIDGDTGAAIFAKGNARLNADGSGALGNVYSATVGSILKWFGDIYWADGSINIGKFKIYQDFLYYASADDKVNIRMGDGIFPSSTANKGLFYLKDITSDGSTKRIVTIDTGKAGETGSYGLSNMAVEIANGTLRVAPNNIVDMPGLLMAGKRMSGSDYKWGKGYRLNAFSNNPFTVEVTSDLEYKIHHNLGHSNYVLNVTPVLPSGASWMKYHPIIIGLNSEYVGFVFIDSGTSNTRVSSDFCFSIFGNNT